MDMKNKDDATDDDARSSARRRSDARLSEWGTSQPIVDTLPPHDIHDIHDIYDIYDIHEMDDIHNINLDEVDEDGRQIYIDARARNGRHLAGAG